MRNEFNHPDWEKCPEGVLSEAVTRMDKDVRRESFRRMSGVAFVVSFIFVVGALQWGSPVNSKSNVDDLSCSEVAQLLPQYKSNRLTAEMTERVDAHLALCPECKRAANAIAKYPTTSTDSILFAFSP